MNIAPFGDSALLINFEQVIDPVINKKVIALFQSIKNMKINGVDYLTPAYCSLAVGFNPHKIKFEDLKKIIQDLDSSDIENEGPIKSIVIPACYSNKFALDKQDFTEHCKLEWNEIIKLHTSIKLRVYMLGFLPGFVYMGSVPEKIAMPRKEVPRLKVPKLSVGIAGFQTGIYPTEAPGGWQILGRTPIRVFDNRRSEPFLFEPGMSVRFRSITTEEYDEISARVNENTFQPETLHE